MNTLEKLNDMVGNTYMYKTKNITIRGYFLPNDEAVSIKTDVKNYIIPLSNLPGFIGECLEVEVESERVSLVPAQKNEVSNMKNILLDNIKKIQEDKAYINQAKAINNNINTLLNMVKLEIQISREMNK